MKHAAIIVLEALMEGQELEIEFPPDLKLLVAIVETDDAGHKLCHIMRRIDTKRPDEEPEKVYMRLDVSVNQLLTYADTLSDDELFIIASNTSLSRMSKERAAARKKGE